MYLRKGTCFTQAPNCLPSLVDMYMWTFTDADQASLVEVTAFWLCLGVPDSNLRQDAVPTSSRFLWVPADVLGDNTQH